VNSFGSGFGKSFIAPIKKTPVSVNAPTSNSTSKAKFAEGQRVFHEKFGIGHIEAVNDIGDSLMYTIDFGKNGKKAMDAAFARLKKF
jgi:transcription elongation factor GreA-like protein